MFKFTEEVIYTGAVTRKSKKTDKEYTLLNFLDENGQSVSAIADCDIPKLNQLDRMLATFKLELGRYMQLKIVDIQV